MVNSIYYNLLGGCWLLLVASDIHTRMFGLSLVKHVHDVGSHVHLNSHYETIMSRRLSFCVNKSIKYSMFA